MNYLFVLILFASISIGCSTIMTAAYIAEIFKLYDYSYRDQPEECMEGEVMADNLCPKDESIPCSPLEDLRKYCVDKVGNASNSKIAKVKNNGENPIEGCMRYVGFYIFDENEHMACCDSDICEEWIDEKFNKERVK